MVNAPARLDKLPSQLALPPADGLSSHYPGQVSANGTHYRLEGNRDGNLVVLISGIYDPPVRYDLLVPALAAAGYRTLRFDPYGRGWSTAPSGFSFTAAAHVQQLVSLVDELGLKPAVLVAHSAGSITALLYAEQAPSVSELVLFAPAGAMANPLPCFRTLQKLLGCLPFGVRLAQRMLGDVPPGDFLPPPQGTTAVEAESGALDQLVAWNRAWDVCNRRRHGTRSLAASILRLPLVTLKDHQFGDCFKRRDVRALVMTAQRDPMVRGVDVAFYKTLFGEGATVDPPRESGGHCFFLQDHAAVWPRILDFLTAPAVGPAA